MFVVKDSVFAENLESKRMVVLKKGDIVNPRLIKGNECIVALNNVLYSVTTAIFELFFEKLEPTQN